MNYTIAANVMPLGIGLLASSLLQSRQDIEVDLFKYPADLADALSKTEPDVIGFSNYTWNLELSYAFAERVKKKYPNCVIVFGGPNYGLTQQEIEDFWLHYSKIDFYVVLEAEIAFTMLINMLIQESFDIERVKKAHDLLANCHFLSKGHVVQTKTADRLIDLDSFPSPYITGLMDKFFDNQLIPLTHTTRGCPFTCTFCSEGSKYYQKVAQRSELYEELRYIAERRGLIPDLALSDANFGMFVQDRSKADEISSIRREFGWPERLVVSTGKNQKARILEVADVLDGALSVAASLQSTDPIVLENIKRSNISLEALQEVVEGATDADSPTYTEIILNLPGDSFERHEKSLRDVTNLGLGVVRMYQLILLPQTEMNTPESKTKYGFKTKFRINPRSFGRYTLFGEAFVAAESEEIVIASNSMTFEDYLACRELDLTVEIVHNTSLFSEVAALFRLLNLSWFDLVRELYELRNRSSLSGLFESYRLDNLEGLYSSRHEVTDEVTRNIEAYLADFEGTNEIAKAKAVAVSRYFQEIHEIVFSLSRKIIMRECTFNQSDFLIYLDELERYSEAKKREFLNSDCRFDLELSYDFVNLEKSHFELNPLEVRLAQPETFSLHHSGTQIEIIRGYTTQYDVNTIDGLGRVLMRANPKRLFRSTVRKEDKTRDEEVGVIGDKLGESPRVNAYGGFTVD